MKKLLSFFRVINMIQLVLKIRDKMMMAMVVMMIMSSASVQGIPLSVLSGQSVSGLSGGRRLQYEEAGLRLAATGFLLMTSLKMETGCLRARLDRFSFHIETTFKYECFPLAQ